MSFPSLMVGILENAQEKPTYLILVFANLIVKYVTFTHEISHVPNKVKEEKKKKETTSFGFEFACVIILDVFFLLSLEQKRNHLPILTLSIV